jgi:hypothetical protein
MPSSEQASSPKSSSFNSRLAKAETVLLLALLSEALLNPWLFSQTQIPCWARTLIKMALVVGCFGPVFKLVTYVIDNGLSATRTVTTSVFSLPRTLAHLLVLALLFTGFHWQLHREPPWREFMKGKKSEFRNPNSVAEGR